jgi:hypothetical protein
MPPNQKTDNLEKIKTFVAKIRKTIKSPDTDAAKRYDLFEAVLSDKINLETVNKLKEQLENQLANFNKNSLNPLPIQEVQDIITTSPKDSSGNDLINQGGVCKGLSLLWSFNQRQEERKEQGPTTDEQISDPDKLLSTMEQIIKWSKTSDASNIIWHDPNIKHDKTNNNESKKIKSQDIEILISNINSIQKSPKQLFGEEHAQELKNDIINNNDNIQHLPEVIRQQNLAFLETIEKKDGKDITKRPELILDSSKTSCKLVDQATIASYLKEIVKPGLITSLIAQDEKEAHATSVYMKKDGSMTFYDPNAGEFALGKNDFEGLAKLYMQQMSSIGLVKKEINKADCTIARFEVYSLNQGKELEKDREIVTNFKDIVRQKEEEANIKDYIAKSTEIFSADDFLNSADNTKEKLTPKLDEILLHNNCIELEFTHNKQLNKVYLQKTGDNQYWYKKNNEQWAARQTSEAISQDLIDNFSNNNSLPKMTTKIYSQNQGEYLEKDRTRAREITLKLRLAKLKESVTQNLERIDNKKSKNQQKQEKVNKLKESIADIDNCIKDANQNKVQEMIQRLTINSQKKTGLFRSTTYKNIKNDITRF